MSPIVVTGQRDRPSATGEAGTNLAWQIKQLSPLYLVKTEYRFDLKRKWRFDVAVLGIAYIDCEPQSLMIAVEIEGGIFAKAGGGRHNRGAGMKADLEKYAEAALLGWMVLRVLPEWVTSGKALNWVERAIAMRQQR